MSQISVDDFRRYLMSKLGTQYDRAEKLFSDCGPNLAFDVTNVMMLAADQGPEKVEEVLLVIEKHYQEHLGYQHPDIRGLVKNLGVNPTETVFLGICRDVLRLKPVETVEK